MVIAAGYITMVFFAIQTGRPYERIYTKENTAGETNYMITSMDEERIREKYPADNWMLAAKYPVRQYENADGTKSRTQIHDVINGTCLIWDKEWFLWNMETGEKTILSLTTEDPNRSTVQLLGDGKPEIIALATHDHSAAGFFSIAEDRMITGWDFEGWGDEMIDGQIPARIGQYDEEKWYLVDPATGEVTGTLPSRP